MLAESALELVPKEAWKSPSVASDARRRGVEPSRILLDRSFHHSAMLKMRDGDRRGRPDLVHTTLLCVAGTPLYLDGKAKAYVHTLDGRVLEFRERTRLPKSYFRFRGLMEKLLADGGGEGLVDVYRSDIPALVKKRVASDFVLGLSVQGRMLGREELARLVGAARNPCVLVGGFPRGHFSPETAKAADDLVRIDQRPLEAHVVASRVVYDIERGQMGLND